MPLKNDYKGDFISVICFEFRCFYHLLFVFLVSCGFAVSAVAISSTRTGRNILNKIFEMYPVKETRVNKLINDLVNLVRCRLRRNEVIGHVLGTSLCTVKKDKFHKINVWSLTHHVGTN